jgi:predicted RNA-binding Zn-ribbon protein involved in translation (DUF1610 family)
VRRITISKPTMCLECHLVVKMERGEEAWTCPVCGKKYRFVHWKIKPDDARQKKGAAYGMDHLPS